MLETIGGSPDAWMFWGLRGREAGGPRATGREFCRFRLGGEAGPGLTGGGYAASLWVIVSAPLKLYVKTWCPWCITARQYLVKRGFRFEEIDVEADRAAYAEMIRLSGQTYTPTLSVEDKLLADFGPDELQVFLQKHHIEP